ncbi:hypothetical protein NXZ46_25655 [Escherichia coli]|nr:hypothetical protein [Escherichia coli]
MISYQGLVRTFPRFFQIVAFFKKHPEFDLSVYLGPISVPYMPQKNSPTDKWFFHGFMRKIKNGWKSFNTHTIEKFTSQPQHVLA